jgi:hypothetical protein
MAKAKDDLLVLCVRTEAGQRRLERAAVDPVLARRLFDASGAELEKALDHGTMSPASRRRLRQLWWRRGRDACST